MDDERLQLHKQYWIDVLHCECRTGHIAEKHPDPNSAKEGLDFTYIIVKKDTPAIKRVSFREETKTESWKSEILELEDTVTICHFENGETFEYGYYEPDEKEWIIEGYGATEEEAWKSVLD